MSNNISNIRFEEFIDSLSNVSAAPRDTPLGQPPGDYLLKHDNFGNAIVELKELQEPEEFEQQWPIANQIENCLKGIFKYAGFYYRFNHMFSFSGNLLKCIKAFLKRSLANIKQKCIIIIPEDMVNRPSDLVTIERLDYSGSVLELIFSPETDSGKYPFPLNCKGRIRRFKDKCSVSIGDKLSLKEEGDIWEHRGKAIIELTFSDSISPGNLSASFNGISLDERRRIRDRIDSANQQLKDILEKESPNCPLGTIICPTGFMAGGFSDFTDIFFGDPGISFDIPRNGEEPSEPKMIYTGTKAFMDKNSTTGFVGWLECRYGKNELSIVHNLFSPNQIRYEYFHAASVKHYSYSLLLYNYHVYHGLQEVDSSAKLHTMLIEHMKCEEIK